MERGVVARGGGAEGRPLSPAAEPPAASSPWYRDKACVQTILGYGAVALTYCVMDELTPVFASTPVAQGGLGLTEERLALPLAVGGATLIAYTLLLSPMVASSIGFGQAMQLGLALQVPFSLLTPVTALFTGHPALSYAFFIASFSAKSLCGVMCFSGSMLLVNKAAPKDQMGGVNGAGMTVAALGRAVGPMVGGWLWSASMSTAVPGFQFLPFGASGLLCAASLAYYRTLPEDLRRS